jgi:hypothetical protein
MSDLTTRKANMLERLLKRIGEFELDEWLAILFWVPILGVFVTDPLNLYENRAWWVYIVLSILLLLTLSLSLATLAFVGKIYFLVQSRFEEYRRNELRELFKNSPFQLEDGVVMRGKWKELYELLKQNVPLTTFYSRTEKFQDVEVKNEDGKSIEYPVTKWRIKSEAKTSIDDLEYLDDTEHEDEWDRFFESGWNAFRIPSPSRLILEGFWVSASSFVVIGAVLAAYGLLNQ